MKRKICCVMLALCMLFTGALPVMATGTNNPGFEEELLEKTFAILQFIEPEKEMYGMAGVDFSSLYLGARIPAYIVQATGIVEETDILYYPIMSGSKWVATAIVTPDSAGKTNVQISVEYAQAYNNKGAMGEVALVFDESAAYVMTQQDILMAAVSPDTMPGRASIQDFPEAANINRTRLVAEQAIGNVYSTRGSVNQFYLHIPLVKQAAGSDQCWAACITSICGYYGTKTTIDKVYEAAGVPKYQGATVRVADTTLKSFGFSTNWEKYGYTWEQMELALYGSDAPIYTTCKYYDNGNGTSNGHAVVIRGFYVYQNISQVGIISYMDPIKGVYAASTVETDGDFKYVPPGSSKEYDMVDFVEVIG